MSKQIPFPESALASLKQKIFRKRQMPWIMLARHRRKNDVVTLRGRLSRSPETERLFGQMRICQVTRACPPKTRQDIQSLSGLI